MYLGVSTWGVDFKKKLQSGNILQVILSGNPVRQLCQVMFSGDIVR